MHLNKYTRMTEETKQNNNQEDNKKPQDQSGVMMTGHIKIFDPESGEVLVDKEMQYTMKTCLKVLLIHWQTKRLDSYTKWRLETAELR